MENTISILKNVFDKLEWHYSFNEEKKLFTTGIKMNNAVGNLNIIVFIRDDSYSVYAILNSHVEPTYMHQVAEYLHRANFDLKNGNFELDYDDGEIRYKTYVNIQDIELSEAVALDSILVPVFMFDRYGKNLMKLLISEGDPEQLILEAENSEDDD